MTSRRSFFGKFAAAIAALCAAPFACKATKPDFITATGSRHGGKTIHALVNGKITRYSWDADLTRRYLTGDWKRWKAIDEAYDNP